MEKHGASDFDSVAQKTGCSYPQLILPIGAAVAVFLIDLKTPQGVIDGYLYTLVVLACLWVPFINAAL